ncbi:MAG TPA: glycosyltransferase [Anaerolineae bacterium]
MSYELLTVLRGVLLLLVGLFFVWKVLTHACTWYYFARYDGDHPLTGYEAPVSIIKPAKGVDQSAFANFRSFCEQDYSSDYEILFCVDDPGDASVPIIRQTMAAYPDQNIRLVYSDPDNTRAVGKLKKTIAGLAQSSYEVIIFSDSDAYAPPTFLEEAVACVEDPATGLGFSAPVYRGPQDWGAALMATSVNELVLNMATPSLFGLFDGAVGTTMVVRREVIEQIGGLEWLGRQIVDDIPLSRAIRKQGYRIHLLKQPAVIQHHHDTFRRWWWHWHRWQVIIRKHWPVKSLVMNVLDLALWWALFYLLLSGVRDGNIATGILLAVAVLATSLLSAIVININYGHIEKLWRFLWVIPIREVVRLPLLIHSYLSNEFVWRGERFRVHADGTATVRN